MSKTATKRRSSKPRGGRSSARGRQAAPRGSRPESAGSHASLTSPAPFGRPLADSPALCQLAELLSRSEREEARELEHARQRQRAAAIARERAELLAREERARLERREYFLARNRPRARQEERILDLLRRGAGVTQILREIVRRSDGPGDIRGKVAHVDDVLTAVAAGEAHTGRIRMTVRDVQRTRRFLGRLAAAIKDGQVPDLAPQPAWAD